MKRPARKFPFDDDIYARVRFMFPAAAKIIAEGFDDHRCEWSEHLPENEVSGLSDEQLDQLMKWTATVYAVGIAIGLRLDPALFDRGGAR